MAKKPKKESKKTNKVTRKKAKKAPERTPRKKARPQAKKIAKRAVKKKPSGNRPGKKVSTNRASAARAAAVKASVRRPRPSIMAEALAPFLAQREISGAVTLVADEKRILHLEAHGLRDVAKKLPMASDSLFAIASMTKPLTTAAVLMLQDEGKLSVEDPVGKYLPELARLTTPAGSVHAVTIRQILTHTSGMGEATPEEWRASRTLADLVPAHAAKPLRFVPGSQWGYCQSGMNTAARLVEVVSGKYFPRFLRERLFGPLGMVDSGHVLTEAQALRLAKLYARTEGGALTEAVNVHGSPRGPTDPDALPAGNAGLYSTAEDYSRFARMLLGGGVFENLSLLAPASVALMGSNLTGDLAVGFTPGNVFGLGCGVVRHPQGPTADLTPGTFGHGGAWGTQAWIDPVKKRVHILMVQRANFPNADASAVRAAFHRAARAI